MRGPTASIWASIALLLLLPACAAHRTSLPPVSAIPAYPEPTPSSSSPDRSPLGARVIAHAEAMSAAGLPRSARHDCSGFVTAAFAAAGHPLDVPPRFQRSHSMAKMLHDWSAAEGRTFQEGPRPGDIVFFRDTLGPFQGQVTHVALVDRVEEDGTIVLIHYMDGRVRHDRMSLARPTDPAVNAYLRRKKHAGDPVLAGQLFVAYARFDEGRSGGIAER